MKTVHTVQSFLDTFCQNGLQFRIICACKAVKGANRNCHSVITASWLNSPLPIPHPHLGNVVTIISTPGLEGQPGRPIATIGEPRSAAPSLFLCHATPTPKTRTPGLPRTM